VPYLSSFRRRRKLIVATMGFLVILVYLKQAYDRTITYAVIPPEPSKEIRDVLKETWFTTGLPFQVYLFDGNKIMQDVLSDRDRQAPWRGWRYSDLSVNRFVTAVRFWRSTELGNNSFDVIITGAKGGKEEVLYSKKTDHEGSNYLVRHTRWDPAGERIVFVEATGNPTVDLLIWDNGTIKRRTIIIPYDNPYYPTINNISIVRWIHSDEILFVYSHNNTHEDLGYGIARFNVNDESIDVLCTGIDWWDAQRDARLLFDEKCPNLHPELWQLFGDPANPVWDPIIPPGQDRFYFYRKSGYRGPICKRWIEGYDREKKEVFHVHTYDAILPCVFHSFPLSPY
jgi:hypothetical protein